MTVEAIAAKGAVVFEGLGTAGSTDDGTGFDSLIEQLGEVVADLRIGNSEYAANLVDLSTAVRETTGATADLLPVSSRMSTSLHGLPKNGYYLFRIGETNLRGRLSPEGKLSVFVGANTEFTLLTFDPTTQLIGTTFGKTGNTAESSPKFAVNSLGWFDDTPLAEPPALAR